MEPQTTQQPTSPTPAPTQQPPTFSYWLRKNKFYHNQVIRFYTSIIPAHARVLQINCAHGYLLDALRPAVGVGICRDSATAHEARAHYPHLTFCTSIDQIPADQLFDYIIVSFVTTQTNDIQQLLTDLQALCIPRTRLIIETYSYLWEPALWLAQKLGLRRPTEYSHWISRTDLENFMYLAGFQAITSGGYLAMPWRIPFLSNLINRIFSIPPLHIFSLHQWVMMRVAPQPLLAAHQPHVSIVIPCRNEAGTLHNAIERCPQLGSETEIIIVEGNSTDNTYEVACNLIKAYPHKNIRVFQQDGIGKGDAVRKGFSHASGDIFMILDADLSVPPEELPKFYEALVSNKGEFVNGSRLVYGMESDAMRLLNLPVNYAFGLIFSWWILGQRVKDTLCGTKVLWARDYYTIAAQRSFFGNGDPFGDFDLLLGASRLHLKIVDLPIAYKRRTYGTSNISRFKHGWMLLRMTIEAFFKIRFYH